MSPTQIIDESVPANLEPRFVAIKKRLIKPENIDKVTQSWKQILVELDKELTRIAEAGPSYVPKCDFSEIKDTNKLPPKISALFKQRGVIMVDNVIDTPQIDLWFNELVEFCKDNPETAGYTFPNPTAWYNIFWTKPQTEARFHPNMKKLFKTMANEFHVDDESTLLDLDTQIVYGDRIRIREPGSTATLPLHLDSSSIERWEDIMYSKVYEPIFNGEWEDWDPFKLDERTTASENLYEHIEEGKSTICSAFRTLQGWLALSNNKSGEGTLRVLPNIKLTMAYIMLRPFFWQDPKSGNLDDYEIDLDTPKFPGTVPGQGQLFLDKFYHHLHKGVISIPDVKKGSFVFWHADVAHEVDHEHNGDSVSSVLYYGQTPLTEGNIKTLLDTRHAFLNNISPEDYRSQLSEEDKKKEYQGADFAHFGEDMDSKRSMGLVPFEISEDLTEGQKRVRQLANEAISKQA
ncbi:uncharacterized protein J8A68_001138 [[Candida] subhashii]|uniref:DUF1479-domain-containing protein n=1 Tax=[Candida] subhashii TaxID=561895 RepID=A0A8J5V0G9_9ASCO|nr:uncharacterized protein J8A68_001138 [[Candida] subhashii]KAG7665450.1 hypothetical protein J8A68_001138 [[Candida] subhashii]